MAPLIVDYEDVRLIRTRCQSTGLPKVMVYRKLSCIFRLSSLHVKRLIPIFILYLMQTTTIPSKEVSLTYKSIVLSLLLDLLVKRLYERSSNMIGSSTNHSNYIVYM